MIDAIVYTTDKVLFQGSVRSIVLPGEQGVFEILSYHKPFISRLVGGEVVIDGERSFSIKSGLAGVSTNKATIVVEEYGP